MPTLIILSLLGLLFGAKAGTFHLHPGTAIEPFNLAVPFASEIPDGRWVKPWNNACEEASIIMVEAWYQGEEAISITEAKARMTPLFAWEDQHFGGNANSDAAQTVELITAKADFTARIIHNPTLEAIKTELRAGRPVISLNYGYELKNPLHHWVRNGSYYHMMVLTGFDDSTQEFLVNDTALEEGLDYRYSYDTILNSLHDYDRARDATDGPPTVLFTEAKSHATSTSS